MFAAAAYPAPAPAAASYPPMDAMPPAGYPSMDAAPAAASYPFMDAAAPPAPAAAAYPLAPPAAAPYPAPTAAYAPPTGGTLDAALLQQYKAARDEARALEGQQVEQKLSGAQHQAAAASQQLQASKASQTKLQVRPARCSAAAQDSRPAPHQGSRAAPTRAAQQPGRRGCVLSLRGAWGLPPPAPPNLPPFPTIASPQGSIAAKNAELQSKQTGWRPGKRLGVGEDKQQQKVGWSGHGHCCCH
jgi:hypothetical protein